MELNGNHFRNKISEWCALAKCFQDQVEGDDTEEFRSCLTSVLPCEGTKTVHQLDDFRQKYPVKWVRLSMRDWAFAEVPVRDQGSGGAAFGGEEERTAVALEAGGEVQRVGGLEAAGEASAVGDGSAAVLEAAGVVAAEGVRGDAVVRDRGGGARGERLRAEDGDGGGVRGGVVRAPARAHPLFGGAERDLQLPGAQLLLPRRAGMPSHNETYL